MLRRVVLLLLFVLTTFLAYSNDYQIRDINISGLKRTKTFTLLNIIEYRSGDTISQSDLELIEQRIRKAGIFTNEFSVTLDTINELEADLNLILSDKWTLIPLPLVAVSSDYLLFGLFFIEGNLLGLNQSLVSGLIYSDGGFSGFAAYSLPPLSIGKLSYSIAYSSGEKEEINFLGDEISSEKVTNFSTSLTLKDKLTEVTKPSISLGYINNKNISYIKIEPSIVFSNIELLDSFKKGYNLSANFNSKFSFDTFAFNNKISANINNSIILLNNLFYTEVNSGYTFNKEFNSLEFGGTTGSRVLNSGIDTSFYLSALIKYEIKILTFDWGYLTIPLYYESGLVEYDDSYNVYHGPGVSLLSYLNKIALPAIGINFVYDFEQGRYNWGASVGMSM